MRDHVPSSRTVARPPRCSATCSTCAPDASRLGWNATAVALAAAAGPSIGALILSGPGWPWLFAVNLPVGAAALLAGRALPRVAGSGRPLDLVSVALNATVFAGLVMGADLLPRHPEMSMALFPAGFAKIGVGADEHAAAPVIQNHLVEIDVARTAERTGLFEGLHLEGVILEIKAHDIGIGRHGIDALLASGTEQL